ncbi:MAG TPA: hypothetical protein DCQ98_06990 [Planctomycetaceae bacterium]|nr:hypothetical protein [Planctomycetaceae bacterium]
MSRYRTANRVDRRRGPFREEARIVGIRRSPARNAGRRVLDVRSVERGEATPRSLHERSGGGAIRGDILPSRPERDKINLMRLAEPNDSVCGRDET